MIRTVDGLVCVSIGCLLIFLNKPFARGYAGLRNRLLSFNTSGSSIRRGRIIAVFVGVVLVFLGILLLLLQ